jgi:acyl-CoA synthetase (AMP-forming)/AMP-acid ligase II
MTTASRAIDELCRDLSACNQIRLIDAAAKRPKEYTGTEIAIRIDQAKLRLVASNVTSDDTVLFAIRPSITAVAYLQALLTLGIRTTLIDLKDPIPLIRAKIDCVSPDVVLTEPIAAIASLQQMRGILASIGTEVPPLRSFGRRVVTTRPRKGSRRSTRSPARNDDALVVFTSGTMSDPKAVVHTQGTLGAMFASMVNLVGDASAEVVYTDQFHSFLPTLAAGATVIFGSTDTPPRVALELIGRHRATTWFTTPPAVAEVLDLLPGTPTLSHIVVGSSPVTSVFVSDMQRAAPNIRLTAVYAMTEVAPIAVSDGSSILDYRGQGDFVGRPLPDIAITIDSANEILVNGPRVGHYLPSDSGPVHTGDLGHLTPDGDLVLDGRSKDMILSGARNIYPQQHEGSLAQIDGIREVVLIGLRDAYGDEQLWLLVDAEPGVDRDDLGELITESDHGASLPIQGIVFDSIPRSGRSSKIDRVCARQIVSDALNIGSFTSTTKT